jgi:hypothetical protein
MNRFRNASTRTANRMFARGVLKVDFDTVLGGFTFTVTSKHHAARKQRAKHRIAARKAARRAA